MLELDVTDEDHLAGLADQVREHVDGLDGVVHSIAYGNPETLLGGKFLDGPWDDVAQAVQVSAYSLKSLAMATLPLMSRGGSIVGLTFDATVAWPAYDWMGVAKAGAGVDVALPRARPRPRRDPVQPRLGRTAQDAGRQGDPRLRGPRDGVEGPRPARLGRDRPRRPPRRPSAPCSATSSRPPPARSCTSTAASTRWGLSRAQGLRYVPRVTSLVELRVLEGPNLYFPRAAIKLTLDVSTDRRGHRRDGAALRSTHRAAHDASGRRRQRASGSGSPMRAVERLVRAIASGGGHVPARRARPADHRPARLVVAFPWRHRGRAARSGRGGRRRARRAAHPRHRGRGQRRRGGGPPRRAGGRGRPR